jgi:hypothetical protein
MRCLHAAAVVFAIVVRASSCTAQLSGFPPPIEVRVPKPPTVAHGGGETFLPYELHVTNLMAQGITLQRVEVLSADNSALLASLSDSTLQGALARVGTRIVPAERAHLGPGLRAVVYMWVPVSGSASRAIRHRLTVIPDSGSTSPLVLETPAVPVTSNIAVIAPPLRGGVWFAANGPSPTSGHRRAMIPIYGTYYISQRFAIDWVKVDEQGRTHTGDSLQNRNYYAYGNNALAVDDGIITEVKDSIPENVPGANSRAVPITLETVGGNHVIINLGQGRYAFYAHLQPHSIKVHVGEHVKRGQLLGLVGNSGNSTEPHLHFHLSDASSPLGSEGVPYEFETLNVVGACTGFGASCDRGHPVVRRREMPFANELVRFP